MKLWTIWIWVFDRWYDRLRWIIKELLERKLTFIIRAVWTRKVTRVKNGKSQTLKQIADSIKTRKRITYFEYKTKKENKKKGKKNNKNTTKNEEKTKVKIKARVWYEKNKNSLNKRRINIVCAKKIKLRIKYDDVNKYEDRK